MEAHVLKDFSSPDRSICLDAEGFNKFQNDSLINARKTSLLVLTADFPPSFLGCFVSERFPLQSKLQLPTPLPQPPASWDSERSFSYRAVLVDSCFIEHGMFQELLSEISVLPVSHSR